MKPLGETEAAWVSEYFGEEYLQLYQFPPERSNPEIAFIADELSTRIPQDGPVLDLACGQGRHTIPLAVRGYRMTGLDYQENLLRVAGEYAREQRVDVPLVRGDMRELPFTDGVFAAVINLFTAFGYFSDAENAQVLREVARVLRPGGWLIIDVANRDALIRQAQPRSWKRLPNGALVVSEWIWDPRVGRYTHTQMVIGEQGTRNFQHSVRVYTCTELTEMLRQAGLHLQTVYGSFQRDPLTLDAPRMICLAQKTCQEMET